MPRRGKSRSLSKQRIIAATRKLHLELGRALSCHERALFFATKVSPAEEAFDGSPLTIDDYIAYITTLYGDARGLLIHRLKEVANRYKALRDLPELKDEGAKRGIKPDRSFEATVNSINQVIGNFTKIINRAIITAQNKKLPIYLIVSELEREWKGLDNICRLLMDEITYLSGRIDSFSSTLKTLSAIEKSDRLIEETKLGLKAAIFGIFASAVFAGISIWFALDASSEKTEGKILTELQKLTATNQPPSYAALLEDQISSIQHSLDTNAANSSADIRQIHQEIDTLKKNPPAPPTPPASPTTSSQKAISIITIQSH